MRMEMDCGLTKPHLQRLLSDFTGLLAAGQTSQAHSHLRIFAFAVPSTWNAVLSDGSLLSNCLVPYLLRSLSTCHLFSEAFHDLLN